jgi:hypothetical protein
MRSPVDEVTGQPLESADLNEHVEAIVDYPEATLDPPKSLQVERIRTPAQPMGRRG